MEEKGGKKWREMGQRCMEKNKRERKEARTVTLRMGKKGREREKEKEGRKWLRYGETHEGRERE